MRIDLALKYLCLAKSRSSVKKLCEKGAITVNGSPVKASSPIHAGDTVVIDGLFPALIIELNEVPEKQLSKTTAPAYYRVVTK